MTFPIGCSVSFCSKTLPLNTSLFGETVFEKSRVFNLSRFKISICIWCRFVRSRTFEITEWVFVRFLLESTVIKFLLVNKEIKVFPRKVNLKERSVSYSKMNTLLLLCFYFSCWLVKCILCRKWKVPLSGDEQFGFIQDKHYELSVAFDKMSNVFFWLCTSHIDHDMFLLWMVGMTGAGWCCRSGTLSTLFGNAP